MQMSKNVNNDVNMNPPMVRLVKVGPESICLHVATLGVTFYGAIAEHPAHFEEHKFLAPAVPQ